MYLAVVIDAWSRRVVGWSIADHMRAELVADAIDMATWRRRPPAGAIAHSDHGSNYCSWVFGQRLRSAGLMGSMGTVGDALDNAVAERFFAVAPVRTARPPLLADPGRARPSDVHLDRGLLQPDPPPLHPRLPLTRRLRDRDSGMIPTPTPSVIRGPLQKSLCDSGAERARPPHQGTVDAVAPRSPVDVRVSGQRLSPVRCAGGRVRGTSAAGYIDTSSRLWTSQRGRGVMSRSGVVLELTRRLSAQPRSTRRRARAADLHDGTTGT